MKVFGGLKLHPRGFLGAPIEFRKAQIDRPVQVDLIGTATRKITIESDSNRVNGNAEIDDLMKEVFKNEDILHKDAMFRERLFIAALRAFGTVSINEWVDRQKLNPYFGVMQNRVVEDLVGYVFTGQRQVHPMVYLDSVHIASRNSFSVGPNVRAYLSDHRDRMTIQDFIGRWLTHRDGMTDMMLTLRLLFGT